MKQLHIILKYFNHFITSRNTKGFGVHSPFLFNFTRFVLYEKYRFYSFEAIEKLRTKLIKDKQYLRINDYGTGISKTKSISEIAKKSLKSTKQAQLLFRIANYMKVQNILELGTSLGLTTSYLASASKRINCVSLEGCEDIANVAKKNFESLDIQNIRLVIGNIDDTLADVLNEFDFLDLIFIDANHRFGSVISYFNSCLSKVHKNSILVVDDIYWSKEMENAWLEIKNQPQVTSTIDLFHMGIVFFNTDLSKKHYKMRI